MKFIKNQKEPVPTHHKYIRAVYFLHNYARELALPQDFVDQCLEHIKKTWDCIQGYGSAQRTVLAVIYLESRRTRYHIHFKQLVALLKQTFSGKTGWHILNVATRLRGHIGIKKTVMSLQDYIDQSIKKIKESPLFPVYIERHQTWVDRPIEQLVFYTNQITSFFASKRNSIARTANKAAAVLLGANYLLGKSIGRKQAYFRHEDIATELGLRYFTVSDVYYREIRPVLQSKAFIRVLKQWKD